MSSSQAVLVTFKRHDAALPVLACLTAAGVDAIVAEESAKPSARRLFYRFMVVGYLGEPPGPWYVVVSQADLGKARACVGQSAAPPDPRLGRPRLTSASTRRGQWCLS